jgi:hypothetical protein
MHIAYTGPKLLNIDDEGYPVQPLREEPYSQLFRCMPMFFGKSSKRSLF